MELLGESSKTSARQAATSASETNMALSLADDGSQAVRQSRDAMSDLKENVGALANEILALSERVDQIGEISSFVGELAGQTNMLALNAAVEAAHAGEHGKGFAVVATEIRKLADQSTKSVARINQLVGDIQTATHSAVMSTEQGTKVVNRTIELAEQTSDVFENLRAAINRASEGVQQISLNANEQSTGIGQMAGAIESLNEGAQQAASGLMETGDGLQSLNRVVENLQQIVGMTNAHRRR
jgi:methyl-accepting chemotaxis protein